MVRDRGSASRWSERMGGGQQLQTNSERMGGEGWTGEAAGWKEVRSGHEEGEWNEGMESRPAHAVVANRPVCVCKGQNMPSVWRGPALARVSNKLFSLPFFLSDFHSLSRQGHRRVVSQVK